MGLQTIINYSETLTIDRRRVVGVQYTRNEIPKISETPTRNPWKFTLSFAAGLQYNKVRDLLESLDFLDKRRPEVISFNTATGATPGLAYMFAYQPGLTNEGLTVAQQNALTVYAFDGNQLTLTNLPKTATIPGQANGYVFKSGDFIQVQGYPYPFTVVGPATASGADPVPGNVLLNQATLDGSGNPQYLTVTVHRPNFIGSGVLNRNLNVGNQCQFNMFCPNMPTYKLSPGGQNAIISFSSDFQLYEFTGTIA